MPAPQDETATEGLILTRSYRSRPGGLQYDVWLATTAGPVRARFHRQQAVMFVDRDTATEAGHRRAVALQGLDGHPVDAVYFDSQRALVAERTRLLDAGRFPYEADVKPLDRFMMERFITGGMRVRGPSRMRGGVRCYDDPQVSPVDAVPPLRVLSLDIETDGLQGPLLSIAGVSDGEQRVFMVRPPGPCPDNGRASALAAQGVLQMVPDERSALLAFIAWVDAVDPDVLLGWNVVEFDLRYLLGAAQRLSVKLALGRLGEPADVFIPRSAEQPHIARVPGRAVLDGIATLRAATFHFERFGLQDVAQALLGRGKAIDPVADPVAEIRRLWREDAEGLARYNLQDCQLVLDIFAHARLLPFAIERQRLTGLSLDRQGGAVAAFDQLYLPRLHRRGYVAPTVADGLRGGEADSPGGFVMDSVPGLYRNVLLLDFKSLYPSIIRTFCVDPLGLHVPGHDPVAGFDGATFARDGHILPELIATLWRARDRAKADANAPLSQAIKILMNSFYGVLGTPGCRFFDPRLPSSITRRGHAIIHETRACIETRGLQVIYGDTDSVFVAVDPTLDDHACAALGAELSAALTQHFAETLAAEGLRSCLHLQFEAHYRRFLMPTMRGSELGSKKRYAGAAATPDGGTRLVIRGLEAVRTDWTPLARRFQTELLQRVFSDAPYAEYVQQTAAAVRRGQLDAELVYRRRLRRALDDYGRGAPPQVQAARMLGGAVREVSYLITVRGPQPVGRIEAPPDYDHYLKRQLAPAADTVLHFLGTSFDRIAGAQLPLF